MQWSPRTADTVGTAAGAVLAAALAVTADAEGRLLFAVLAFTLGALAVTDLVLRPRLRVDGAGIEVRTVTVRQRLPWSAVHRVAVDERSRYGLTARTLEIDAEGSLVVLGRHSLGADPRDVAAALREVRAGRSRDAG